MKRLHKMLGIIYVIILVHDSIYLAMSLKINGTSLFIFPGILSLRRPSVFVENTRNIRVSYLTMSIKVSDKNGRSILPPS